MKYKLIDRNSGKDAVFTNEKITAFLHTHLGKYGDAKKDILKCLEYVFQEHRGGQILLGVDDGEIVGAVVINHTGMSGYIPANILVYIAVHNERRGKGIGKRLMKKMLELTTGNIALHVEPGNPAIHLYKKLGFTNDYLEMRLRRA